MFFKTKRKFPKIFDFSNSLDKNVGLFSIDGYTIKRCGCNRFGGGVAVYMQDTTFDKCTVRADLPQSTLEALCMEDKPVRSAPFIVLAWYRPPNEALDISLIEESLQ